MLPLPPVYLSYFAGGGEGRGRGGRILAFICGFTLSFMVLGLTLSALGALLSARQRLVDLVCGALMALFGLNILGVVRLPQPRVGGKQIAVYDVFSAFVFGLIYPINLTPCVGAFLGSALALAASSGGAARGALLLLVYSLGLGIPFALSALLMGRLDVFFKAVKEHYDVVERISGGLLILAGILTAAGVMGRWMRLFS